MKIHTPPLRLFFPILAISLFSVISYAATVSVLSTTTYQAYNGVYFNVAGGFTAANNGFLVVQSTGSATPPPCSWTSGGTCQTALTAGHWEYSATLTLVTVPGATTTYTYTVQWNTGTGYTTLGSLTVSVPTTALATQTMTFLIDTGLTSFTAPAGITITVA